MRRALAFVLLASGLKLLDMPNVPTVLILISFAVGGSLLWMQIRRRRGFPALATVEARQRRARNDELVKQESGEREDL